MKIRKGVYNVRLDVDDDGNTKVGFVHRLYSGGKQPITGKLASLVGAPRDKEWRAAPKSTKSSIEKMLAYALKLSKNGHWSVGKYEI